MIPKPEPPPVTWADLWTKIGAMVDPLRKSPIASETRDALRNDFEHWQQHLAPYDDQVEAALYAYLVEEMEPDDGFLRSLVMIRVTAVQDLLGLVHLHSDFPPPAGSVQSILWHLLTSWWHGKGQRAQWEYLRLGVQVDVQKKQGKASSEPLPKNPFPFSEN